MKKNLRTDFVCDCACSFVFLGQPAGQERRDEQSVGVKGEMEGAEYPRIQR